MFSMGLLKVLYSCNFKSMVMPFFLHCVTDNSFQGSVSSPPVQQGGDVHFVPTR